MKKRNDIYNEVTEQNGSINKVISNNQGGEAIEVKTINGVTATVRFRDSINPEFRSIYTGIMDSLAKGYEKKLISSQEA